MLITYITFHYHHTMDIKVVDKAEETPDKIDSKEPEQISGPVTEDLLKGAVAQVMGIETDQDKSLYERDIETLLEYARSQTDDHSPQNLKWIIRSIELKLGTPPLAEKRIKWMARWAYLMMENKKIKEEIKQFEQV